MGKRARELLSILFIDRWILSGLRTGCARDACRGDDSTIGCPSSSSCSRAAGLTDVLTFPPITQAGCVNQQNRHKSAERPRSVSHARPRRANDYGESHNREIILRENKSHICPLDFTAIVFIVHSIYRRLSLTRSEK